MSEPQCANDDATITPPVDESEEPEPKRIGFIDQTMVWADDATNLNIPFKALKHSSARDLRRDICFLHYLRVFKDKFPNGRPKGVKKPPLKDHIIKYGFEPKEVSWLKTRVHKYETKGRILRGKRDTQLSKLLGMSRPGDEREFVKFIKDAFTLGKVFTYDEAYAIYTQHCRSGRADPNTFNRLLHRENHGLTTVEVNKAHARKKVQAADIKEFYMRLMYVIIKHKIKWEHVYNADETGFSRGTKASERVIVPAGAEFTEKSVTVIGNNKTLLETLNATGDHLIPPFIIFAGCDTISLSERRNMAIPDEWHIGTEYKKGWIDSEIFVDYLKHFNEHAGGSELKKILILDNGRVHKTAEVREYAANNNIFIVELPPNAAHILQPLDVGYFSYLKRKFSKEFGKYSQMEQNVKSSMFKAIQESRKYALDKSKVGFAASGIYPLSPNAMLSHDSNHNLVTDWLKYFIEDKPTELQFLLMGGPECPEEVEEDILLLAKMNITAALAEIPEGLRVQLRPENEDEVQYSTVYNPAVLISAAVLDSRMPIRHFTNCRNP